jgi:ferredoxin-thioredoxin reductase catalytic chain
MKNYNEFKEESESRGYYINPDKEFVETLLKNIEVNEKRYGYAACPCRLATGVKEKDLDLICPCDYRDVDLEEYGSCFCALYVNKDIAKGKKTAQSIPDRRLSELNKKEEPKDESKILNLKYPIWRCKVCGYLCSREKPPENCPICKVESSRFEKIL